MKNSVGKNQDFQFIYQNGKSRANRLLVLYVLRRDEFLASVPEENMLRVPYGIRKVPKGQNRLGVSVSKKVGNSVKRHHLCRLVREAYRLHANEFAGGLDLVVIVRPGAKESDFFEIERALTHLGAVSHVMREKD